VTASDPLFARAAAVTPGGVHSPVRAFTGVGGKPVFMAAADRATLIDVDGNRYTDFCMAFGPLILGHAPDAVREAVTAQLARGWSYGTAETRSLELAELIVGDIDWIDSVRFTNSGTEAVMTAIRLARAATGRSRIVRFAGCYHGHSDAMLMPAGAGLAGKASPHSAGIPRGVAADMLVASLDDEVALTELFAVYGHGIAAVIVEPLPANHGLLPQRAAFMAALADLCKRHGSLLIFDEVISGFRLAFGGYTKLSDITPDIVTWGKVIGGGFPVGAVAAKRALMDHIAPAGAVYQAGTLSANPVTMTAGLTVLQALRDGAVYERLEQLGQYLQTALAGHPAWTLQRAGSIFWLAPGNGADVIRTPQDVPAGIGRDYARLFHDLLDKGIYLPPSPFEVGFLSAAHDESDLDRLAHALFTRHARGHT